jgi:hypothetical protein
MRNEIEINLKVSTFVRHGRCGKSARCNIEGNVPPVIQQWGEFETDLAYYRSSRNRRGCGKHNQRDLLIKMSTTRSTGLDAISTYTLVDGLGLNALSDSEKYKKGVRENTTGRTRTLGMWQSCPHWAFIINSNTLSPAIISTN